MFTCCFVKTRHTLWYVLEMKIYNRLWCHCTMSLCFNISGINFQLLFFYNPEGRNAALWFVTWNNISNILTASCMSITRLITDNRLLKCRLCNGLRMCEEEMKRQKRNLFLTVETVHSHIFSDNLSQRKIDLMPPTTASHLQPLNRASIQSFKSHFHRQYFNLILDQFNQSGRNKVLIRKVIRFTKWAWDVLTPLATKHF